MGVSVVVFLQFQMYTNHCGDGSSGGAVLGVEAVRVASLRAVIDGNRRVKHMSV